MTSSDGGEVARLLAAVEAGDHGARDRLIEILQPELRACAARMMRGQGNGHTLQATALVNEAYLKLFARDDPHFEDRRHVVATAATAMRQILIDHARRKETDKRRLDGERTPLDFIAIEYEGSGVDVLSLDEALKSLTKFDPQMGRVAELRVFGGFSFEEITILEDIPLRTLQRKWSATKAWMVGQLR